MKKAGVLIVFSLFIYSLAVASAFWPFDTLFSNSDTCSDTDGGVFSFQKGIVTAKNFLGLHRKYADQCQDVDGKDAVREHYCKNGKAKWQKIVCENGCENGACIKDLHKEKFKLENINLLYVKISPTNKGSLNPNTNSDFSEIIIKQRFEHTLKTLQWLTKNENLKGQYTFLEYKIDKDLEYGSLPEEVIQGILKEANSYSPDFVVILFEGSGGGRALGEKDLESGKKTGVVMVPQPLKNLPEHDLQDFTIFTLHELFHLQKVGGFRDAYLRWCGWSNPEDPSFQIPFFNCYYHEIYGAGGNSYEYPPFLVHLGRNAYKEITPTRENAYTLTIENQCKNETILRIPDGTIKLGNAQNQVFGQFNANYVFSLTDLKSCTNEFQYQGIHYGVKIWRTLDFIVKDNLPSPQPYSFELPLRVEKNANGEYRVLTPITFSKYYSQNTPNSGSYNDIRESYSDENYEIKVLNEEVGKNGEIISTTLSFKVKKDELQKYR